MERPKIMGFSYRRRSRLQEQALMDSCSVSSHPRGELQRRGGVPDPVDPHRFPALQAEGGEARARGPVRAAGERDNESECITL